MKQRRPTPGAVYLNVDLEVRSRSNLMPLVTALRSRLDVLNARRSGGEYFASFEVAGPTLPPDVAVRRLARAVSALPPSARKVWNQARDRVFDIGVERQAGRLAFSLALRPETVKMIARLNARIGLTLY